MSAGGGAIGRREVAVRCFAAEYDDASYEYSEGDEERAPNYVVTPTGARVNRLFVVGVLTEVEAVSDDVLRGRVVDPTGAFVVYAGQYQPDAKAALQRAEPPVFVAVTGKARTFEPDDADRVYTSIRPESINAVDAATRDRWTVQAAAQTIERVATCAAAVEREERGDALADALRGSGVDPALAAGIPRAIDHYGTTPAYLAAVRDLALQAAEVVVGERDEVESLSIAPDEGGTVEADLAADVSIEAPAAAKEGGQATGEVDVSTSEDGVADSGPMASESTADAETTAAAEPGEAASTTAPSDDPEESTATESSDDDIGDFDDFGAEDEASGTESATADEPVDPAEADATKSASTGAADDDQLYEMDEEERAAVEEEFGTEFATGSEVDGPGEADIETPGPDAESGAGEDDGGSADDEAPAEETTEATSDEEAVASAGEEAADEPVESAADADAGEVDVVDAAVEAMRELDDGDGADRDAVVETVTADHGVDADAVEDAIQDALMGGRCYEPDDGRLKAI